MGKEQKESKMLAVAMKAAGKNEKDVLKEKIEDFLVDAVIEARQQVALQEGEVKKSEALMERAQREVAKADKSVATARFAVPSNYQFATYVSNINCAKIGLNGALNSLESYKDNHEDAVEKLNAYKSHLADLEA
jgi:hypothetical protein